MSKKQDEIAPEDFKDEGSTTTGESVDMPATSVLTRLKFDWEEGERETIDTIKRYVDQKVSNEFKEAYIAIQRLLFKVRIAEEDAYGSWMKDERGAIAWKRHHDGSVIEDWSRIEAGDMDAFILNASVYAFFASQQSIDLYMEAAFAKLAHEDAFDDAFNAIMTGTISDKTTSANRKVRQERYFSFYRAYLHKRVKEVVDRLDTLARRVERVREMQLKDREREFRASRG